MEVEEETPPRHPHSRRERGYFTASPRQDRMTYFARLLLSRGASSAPLISNRKSRGEPRRTAGQSARARAPLASAVSAGKKGSPTNGMGYDGFARCPLPRHLHTRPRLLSALQNVQRRQPRSSSIVHSRICEESCRVASFLFLLLLSLVRSKFGFARNGFDRRIYPVRLRSYESVIEI